MMTLQEVLDRHIAKHGRLTTDAQRKLRAFHIVTKGECVCGYCGVALLGDDDSEFDHMDADGAWWRKNVGPSRTEFSMIWDGTHSAVDRRKFACDMCNRAKGTMPYDEYIKSEAYLGRKIAQIILNENADRIAAYIANGGE